MVWKSRQIFFTVEYLRNNRLHFYRTVIQPWNILCYLAIEITEKSRIHELCLWTCLLIVKMVSGRWCDFLVRLARDFGAEIGFHGLSACLQPWLRRIETSGTVLVPISCLDSHTMVVAVFWSTLGASKAFHQSVGETAEAQTQKWPHLKFQTSDEGQTWIS